MSIICKTDEYGTKRWYNENGKQHRDGDLPAVECATGTKYWFKNGEKHRDGDLPATEYANGTKHWYKNSKRHRDGDLPAIECANGHKCWYKNGQLHRDGDLPAVEYADGRKCWFKDGKLHRDGNLPAVESATGYKKWFKHGIDKSEKEIKDAYHILQTQCRRFRGYLLRKKLKRVRWIHQELLCKPPSKSYPGGLDYHKFVESMNNF